MAHLVPDQFVDLADGVLAEADVPHLSTCADCRRQLADVRAMMAEAAGVEAPEPSPLFWGQLSARVREAVAEHPVRRSWRDRVRQPRVWIPALGGLLAIGLFALRQPPEVLAPPAPSAPDSTLTLHVAPPLPPAGGHAVERAHVPSLPPLGAADDPQLSLVVASGAALSWDEMRDEVALSSAGASSDAVFDALTVDEQRELQRLLADEMAQPAAPENRS